MNSVKVVHGNPSEEELAAVVAVLLSLGRRQDSAPGSGTPTTLAREVSWSRGGRAYPAPATSWKFAS